MLLSIDIHICGYVVSYFYSSWSIPRFLRHVKGENCWVYTSVRICYGSRGNNQSRTRAVTWSIVYPLVSIIHRSQTFNIELTTQKRIYKFYLKEQLVCCFCFRKGKISCICIFDLINDIGIGRTCHSKFIINSTVCPPFFPFISLHLY